MNSMKRANKYLFFVVSLLLFAACIDQQVQIELGSMQNDVTVSFVNDTTGYWGIEISGGSFPVLHQQNPIQFELFKGEDNIYELAAGYQSVKKDGDKIVAKGNITEKDGAVFNVEDIWSISGNVLSVNRRVNVSGTIENAGFYSALQLMTDSTIKWEDAEYMAPGLLYGDPTFGGGNSPGGTMNYDAKRFSFREDILSAPLFTISFNNGNWIAVFDPAPDGATTSVESNAPATTTVIDENIQFGALGAHEISDKGVEFGFWLPGTTDEFSRGFGGENAAPIVRRRYNPVSDEFSQQYQVDFLFGSSETFRDMEHETWRWAWESLNPKVYPVDLEIVRRALIDHLEDHVLVVNDIAGVPFLFDAVTGNPGSYRNRDRQSLPTSSQTNSSIVARRGQFDLTIEGVAELARWAKKQEVYVDPEANELARWPQILMGFVCKGIESAEQLLLESERDTGPRGQQMREHGLMIINSFVRLVPMFPPAGTGFNMMTGKPDCQANNAVTIREPSEGMRTLIDILRRERNMGYEHPEWLAWCQQFGDWLLSQQREDGSFPRSWNAGKGTIHEESGTSTYNPVPLLVKLSEETGEQKYLDAAIHAADYVWSSFGSQGIFIGGATDNPNIVDKEAGMLSLNAFLCLFENTKEQKWLERAIVAGNYAETWIRIWNIPMPIGANDSTLNWKRGIPTTGVQGITALAAGGVDQYMAWSVPDYAKLYKYTNDEHYVDVARILLHDTKAMLALPGRTFDLLGPGWQQEHWSMGPRRGYGGHRSWLPWVSVNHLHGITGLQEFDPELYQKLSLVN
jgi:hypothetical protein